MSFPRYPKYKDSGVEWLGEVPDHWKVDRFKRSTVAWCNGIWGNEPQGNHDDIVCVRVADFDRQRLRVVLDSPTLRNVTAREREGRLLAQGDLLLEKSGGGELQPVGCVVIYDHPQLAVCSNFVARIEIAPEMDASYWRYCHAAAYTVRLNSRSIKQTSGIQNLDQQQYFDERAPFPPVSEQRAIAAFLDDATARIDALLTEQRRLIKLLQEKRQTVIAQAVSKGLNRDAPAKQSGVEWIGRIPAHWNVRSLGMVTLSRCDGPFGSGLKSEHYTDAGVRVIRLQNIRADGFAAGDEAFIDPHYYETMLRGHDVQAGDVLVAGLGDDNNTVGRACVAPQGIEPAMVKADCFRFRVDKEVALPEFVALQLSAGAPTDAGKLSSGSTRSRIPLSVMSTRRVALPPLAEQRAIVDYVQQSSAVVDSMIAEAEHATMLLQEHRLAAISAAVTGKIDVRNYSAGQAEAA